MSGGSTFSAPFGINTTVSVFDKVENILSILLHFFPRHTALLSHSGDVAVGMVGVDMRILARNTGCNNGERLSANILAEQEILVVAETPCLVIAPEVEKRFSSFERAYRAFPIVDIVDAFAMSHTTAGEADELRLEVGESLRKVDT